MMPQLHRVLATAKPCAGTTLLRLQRRDLAFLPGQYLALALPGAEIFREYTVYSGIEEPWLEVLIREVGAVSRRLAALGSGDSVLVDGPMGFFTLDGWSDPAELARPRLLIASGVGVAGFHAMARSWPGLDYLLVHGVRCATELYGRPDFAADRHLACLSRDAAIGCFAGRIDAWLDTGQATSTISKRWGESWPDATECWLAGSSEMIHDVFDRLRSLGVPPDQIRTEVFF